MDNNQLPSQSSAGPWMAFTLITAFLGQLFDWAQAATLQQMAYCFTMISAFMACRHYYILNPIFKRKTKA